MGNDTIWLSGTVHMSSKLFYLLHLLAHLFLGL